MTWVEDLSDFVFFSRNPLRELLGGLSVKRIGSLYFFILLSKKKEHEKLD